MPSHPAEAGKEKDANPRTPAKPTKINDNDDDDDSNHYSDRNNNTTNNED